MLRPHVIVSGNRNRDRSPRLVQMWLDHETITSRLDFLQYRDSILTKETHQHTTRRGRNHRISRIRRLLWGQSPYTHQVPKRNALPGLCFTLHWQKTRSKSAVATTYKPMEQPWEQRWPALLLQTSSWPEDKNKYWVRVASNRFFGKGTLYWRCVFVFAEWSTSLDKIEGFVKKAKNFSTIKFTAEMSETEITFLDTKVYKGIRFNKESILDV